MLNAELKAEIKKLTLWGRTSKGEYTEKWITFEAEAEKYGYIQANDYTLYRHPVLGKFTFPPKESKKKKTELLASVRASLTEEAKERWHNSPYMVKEKAYMAKKREEWEKEKEEEQKRKEEWQSELKVEQKKIFSQLKRLFSQLKKFSSRSLSKEGIDLFHVQLIVEREDPSRIIPDDWKDMIPKIESFLSKEETSAKPQPKQKAKPKPSLKLK